MRKRNPPITVFEHQSLRCEKGEPSLSNDQLKALERYYGSGVPYFSLIHRGVQFNESVGVIQVGNTLIEVLPKADRYSGDKDTWRKILIDMLRAVHGFEVKATSEANLKTKPNTILDLYFELFVREVEALLHTGLIKKYRKDEDNNTALKGNLLFSKHISLNVAHQERFYTRYSVYDRVHSLNQVLLKTLRLLSQINTNPALSSRIGALLLNFPDMPDVKVSPAFFERIVYNRKNLVYKRALEISKLILLKYHPDLSGGSNHVLALMFDMNILWQEFVFVSLRKSKDLKVRNQQVRYFWKPEGGAKRTIRPDLVVEVENKNYALDTKWKNVNKKPAVEDLRQMYAYHHYFEATKTALFYPGEVQNLKGWFIDRTKQHQYAEECGLLFTRPNDNVREWQVEIQKQIYNWING